MKDQKHEILEVIDGFKNLTYKIKKDNDEIKQSVKGKDQVIASCKTEYQKLYAEYEELAKRNNELENYIVALQKEQQKKQELEIEQQKQEQQKLQLQIQKQKQREKKILKRRHYILNDSGDNDDNDDDNEYSEDESDFKYIKVKKKKKPINKKIKKKGIMQYINDNQ